ncbi:Mannan endo-1,4-beta-mannosidase 6 [Acorus calamus]|uniref:mannan endo-1,4-beta-mannosidase n=1 Tax=Acorus calamus TaxID=4465 RepID=A0AAV9ERI0_ACOCL|nr:Mannan endo-1,4-beta-mannosidase 6 [Acorus calamus]
MARRHAVLGVLMLAVIVYFNWGGGGGFQPPSQLLPPSWWPFQPKLPDLAFLRRNGTRFVSSDTGDDVYVNGWNSYWLMSEAATGRAGRVEEMLRRGRAMGLFVCRTWAFSDGGGSGALQISPGRLDFRVFQALDYVIYEARRNQIRLILCLVNDLNAFGGKAQYVKWAESAGVNTSSMEDPFFAHPIIKGYYKDYVKAILTRKNSFSGVRYSDEPAIFAWELMNEPRCVSNASASLLQAWITEMAAYVKSMDQNHLVTVGLEGFYGSKRSDRLGTNPGVWAASLGSDFIQNSAIDHIDFASAHAYPDTWIPKASLEEKVKYLSKWVDSHLSDGENVLKKPILFTEIGSRLREKLGGMYDRDLLLKTVYDKIYKSAKKKQAGQEP